MDTTHAKQAALPHADVLLVDDEQSMRQFLSMLLKKEGLEVEQATHGDEAIALLNQGRRYKLILTDLKMPGSSGLDVLQRAKALDPACQVVIMTAFATAETALEAIRQGAYDYMIKPFKLDQAQVIIRRALEKHSLLSENLYLKEALGERRGMGAIIGKSEAMLRVFELVKRVAPTQTIVLITGESGTGKELAAQAIHQHSLVADGPFLPINCGAIPEHLIESELFGHKKGSFTGAISDKKGLFESAEHGTVFLDEIGELPLNTQVQFLRVLQSKVVRPVGSSQELAVNCRVIAATNRDLRKEVQEGRFREDLYYRLNVIPIELPPLRAREGDVKLLLEYYMRKYSDQLGRNIEGIEADAMRVLLNYSYPGNIRELQNIMERAVTLETRPMIGVNVLPYHMQNETITRVAEDMEIPDEGIELEVMVEQLERTMIRKALERTKGVKKEAAKVLGITFRSLRYRLDKYGMNDGED